MKGQQKSGIYESGKEAGVLEEAGLPEPFIQEYQQGADRADAFRTSGDNKKL